MDWWRHLIEAFARDFADLPDGAQFGQIGARVLVAALLGAMLGYERERKGKAAGIRTHMLVALAAALFIILPQQAGISSDGLARVIQGVAAGVGFLGAGAIIKQSDQQVVHGLTTAAGLYLTTAIGIAAGLGKTVGAILGTLLAVAVISLVPRFERWAGLSTGQDRPQSSPDRRHAESETRNPAVAHTEHSDSA